MKREAGRGGDYRARTLHSQGAVDHVVDAFLDAGALRRVAPVVHDALVEVAVADVAQDAGEDAEGVHFFLGDFYRASVGTDVHSERGKGTYR